MPTDQFPTHAPDGHARRPCHGLFALVLLAAGACANHDVAAPLAGPDRIRIGSPEASLVVHASQRFDVTVTDAAGQVVPSPAITWTSSDTTVATVDGSGVVFARAVGTATITAAYRSVRAAKAVAVRPGEIRLTLSPGDRVLAPGATVMVTAEVLDALGQPLSERVPPVVWSVQRGGIVAITPVAATTASTIQITGTAWGMAVLRAQVAGQSAWSSLIVTPPAVDDGLTVEEFRLHALESGSGTLTEYTPVIAVSHPSSALDITRFDLLIPGIPDASPSMCGGLRLDAGQRRYLFGFVGYDFELTLQFRVPRLPDSDAVVLLTYRTADGELRGRLARGPVTVSAQLPPLPDLRQTSWAVCS